MARLSSTLLLWVGFVTLRAYCGRPKTGPTTPTVERPQAITSSRFRLIPVRSPLLRESLLVSFPEGTKMFQFPSFASLSGYQRINAGGFPHSEISGSLPVSGSPKLIAAFHVLHRLSAPRHPPCALSS